METNIDNRIKEMAELAQATAIKDDYRIEAFVRITRDHMLLHAQAHPFIQRSNHLDGCDYAERFRNNELGCSCGLHDLITKFKTLLQS